jgi:hypothetical protein
LQQLYARLAGFPQDEHVRYWRGFALWRKTINGFNSPNDPKERARDAEQAVREFEGAGIEGRIATVSCVQMLFYLARNDKARTEELAGRFKGFYRETLAAAPENPRLMWIQGAQLWYEGKPAEAMALYERALAIVRKEKAKHPLDPAWGEPELLMSLAWGSLNIDKEKPDVAAAERYANQALSRVPHFRYVRDTLLPQIKAAKEQQASF